MMTNETSPSEAQILVSNNVLGSNSETSQHHVEELQKIGQQLKLFENNSKADFIETVERVSSFEVSFAETVVEPSISVIDSIEISMGSDSEKETISEADVASGGLNLNTSNFISTLADEALLKEIESIPKKLAFKIGDVADMLSIKQYVLRYWETEFDLLKPKKAQNNQRMYSRNDVENAYLIRKLLHRDRFSIEGAKQVLKTVRNQVKKELKTVEAKNYDLAKLDKIESNLIELSSKIFELKKIFS